MLSTICILFTGWIYTMALIRIYQPLTKYRKFIIYSCQFCYYVALIVGQKILNLSNVPFNWMIILLALIAFSMIIIDLATYLFKTLLKLFQGNHKKTKKISKP